MAKTPHLHLKMQTSDGFTSEQKGPSTDEELFAVLMLTRFADNLEPAAGDAPHVAEFRGAVAAFMAASVAYKEKAQLARQGRDDSPTG